MESFLQYVCVHIGVHLILFVLLFHEEYSNKIRAVGGRVVRGAFYSMCVCVHIGVHLDMYSDRHMGLQPTLYYEKTTFFVAKRKRN